MGVPQANSQIPVKLDTQTGTQSANWCFQTEWNQNRFISISFDSRLIQSQVDTCNAKLCFQIDWNFGISDVFLDLFPSRHCVPNVHKRCQNMYYAVQKHWLIGVGAL